MLPYDRSVSPNFLLATDTTFESVLTMMAQLYAQGNDPFDPARARHATGKLMAEPEFGGVWTIHMDGAIAGYMVVVLGYSLEFGGRFGLLDELFVDAAWRGCGLGSAALGFAEKQCRERGWQALRLEVGNQNEPALGLYRRSGFEVHDRFLMTKWI